MACHSEASEARILNFTHASSLTKAVKPVTVIKTVDAADETTS